MSQFFLSQSFKQAKIAIGFGEAHTQTDYGVWEPEKSVCFERVSDLTEFYSILAHSDDIVMIDPNVANYNPYYITLGLGTMDRRARNIGMTFRSRFNYDLEENIIKDPKFCIKDAGKEMDRREFQSGRKTLCVKGNIKKLAADHPTLPKKVSKLSDAAWLVDSVQGISRSGFFFAHLLPEFKSVVWHAGSKDACNHSIPSIYKDVKHEDIVICGRRIEGEVEAIGVDIMDPVYMSEDGKKFITETSLTRIMGRVENSGLPIIPNEWNKVEDAQHSAARYFEEIYTARNGRQAALAQNMRPKDYTRRFMKEALGMLSQDLPAPGSLYPRQLQYADNGLLIPAHSV